MILMFKLSLISMLQRKSRTALIALSIAIGVFSVLIISIISDNGVVLINNELDILGLSGVSISTSSPNKNITLTNTDLDVIKDEYYVESATPVITATGYLKNDELSNALVCGIDENAKSVISVETVNGKKISKNEIDLKANVCAIDEKTANILFKTPTPIGKQLDIFIEGKTTTFTVIGTVKASSSLLQTSVGDLLPSIIYVPYTTLQQLIGKAEISQIAVDFSSKYSNEFCIESIKTAVGGNFGSYLKFEDLNKQRESLNGILDIITTVLRLIGGVSLLVSGLGIMTIMLITVKEKTKEIGIKKSIGAKNKIILFEFIFESAVISGIGSIIGIVLMLFATGVARIIFNVVVSIDFLTVFLTALIAILCGVLFGIYPAFKAATLNPIDALRSE